MKFKTTNEVKNIFFLTDDMGYLLKENSIPLTDVIKLPDHSDKLSMDDIITVGELQLIIASLYGKAFISPFTEAKVNEIFTAKFNTVINKFTSDKVRAVEKSYNQFYIRAFGDNVFIGMSTAGNKNTFFTHSNSFNELDSTSIKTALVEAIYKAVFYQELHFQNDIIVSTDELCFTDILAGLGKPTHD